MFVHTKVNFYDKNHDVRNVLRRIAAIGAYYAAMPIDQLENLKDCQQGILFLKSDLLLVCELLRAMRVGQNEAFKNKFYYAVVLKEENDPVDVIRHGLVHYDMLIPPEDKFKFYQATLKIITSLSNLNPDNPRAALSFGNIKEHRVYQIFLNNYLKTKGSSAVAHTLKFDNTLADKLLMNIAYIAEVTAEPFSDECKSSMSILKLKYKSMVMALAEMGEILNQTKNLYERLRKPDPNNKDDYTIYLNIGSRKVWLPTSVINDLIKARNCVCHYSDFDSHLEQALASVEFVKQAYAAPTKKATHRNQ